MPGDDIGLKVVSRIFGRGEQDSVIGLGFRV